MREQERSHQASPLFQTMIEGRLGAQSAELIANLRKTLADTERLLSTPRTSVASALDGGQHRRSEDDLRSGTEAHRTTSERGKMSYDDRGTRDAVDANDEPYFYTDPCSLLAGRHEPYTDRSEPETRKHEAARGADKSRVTGQELAAGPRRGRVDFYNGAECGEQRHHWPNTSGER